MLLWTTFTSEQVDLDVHHPASRHYLANVLDRMRDAGIAVVRLDAVGFAVKKAGTSCFMIPETFDFIADLAAQAHERRIDVLVEVHGHYQEQLEIYYVGLLAGGNDLDLLRRTGVGRDINRHI